MEFVVCDDEKTFREKIVKVINKSFINNDDDYHIYEFEKYNKDLETIIKKNTPKIYILDIEMNNSISGIDIARKIRRNDWESVIILVTSHSELGYQALKAQIMLLDFISKYDDCEKNLEQTINKALKLVKKKKAINFEADGISYVIFLNDILYIERDTVDRKCSIKTLYTNISINKNLCDIEKELDKEFYMCHRSCIVNTSNISKIDWKKNIIYFKNGSSIDLISRNKRKGLKEYVSN